MGQAAFRVVAKTGEFSDGELRTLPLLPSRMRLVQSKFATLRDKDVAKLTFDDLARTDDPTRLNEQLVVTVDAQLFFTVLQALPYLARYPYECTEQTLNRFVSTGIVTSNEPWRMRTLNRHLSSATFSTLEMSYRSSSGSRFVRPDTVK